MTIILFIIQEERNNNTALMLACLRGHKTIADLLIQKGASVNNRNKVSQTLH